MPLWGTHTSELIRRSGADWRGVPVASTGSMYRSTGFMNQASFIGA